MRILQWNIWYKADPENIVSFLQQIDADIICVQEVIRDSRTNLDVAKFIADKLGFHYFYHDAVTHDDLLEQEAQGNAIFSRFPIVNSSHVYVQDPTHNPANATQEGRVYLEVTVHVDEQSFTVGTTHLSFTPRFVITDQRKREVDRLIDLVKGKDANYIFTGDLNSTPDSYTIRKLEKILKHCGPDYNEKSWTTKPFDYMGFQEDKLNWRLDYVFCSNDVNVRDSKILPSTYSDHLPILTEVTI